MFTSNDAGGTWTHTTFRANGGQARTGGLFGTAVSLSGSTILVGAPGYHTGSKTNSGTIFIFVNNGSVWTQQTNIRPANVTNAFTGTGVSLFQNTAAFGAPGTNKEGYLRIYAHRHIVEQYGDDLRDEWRQLRIERVDRRWPALQFPVGRCTECQQRRRQGL